MYIFKSDVPVAGLPQLPAAQAPQGTEVPGRLRLGPATAGGALGTPITRAL